MKRSVERVTRAAWLVILATLLVRVVGLVKAVVVPAISGAVVPLAAAAEQKWGRGTERTRRFWGILLLAVYVLLCRIFGVKLSDVGLVRRGSGNETSFH